MAAGVAAIFGGEALCLLGPLRYEQEIHVICHVTFYAGVAIVVTASAIHVRSRRKAIP
jgi:hypothetical protein